MAVEPEPNMLAEGETRAQALGVDNVRFVGAGSDDLRALRSSLGRFRTALMGQSFHWMVEKDRVLHDLSAMLDETDGSVAFVTPWTVHAILERYLADVPPGPHPNGRHDPLEEILARSAFPRVETLDRVYQTSLRPTAASLVGTEYTMSYVRTRLGDRRDEALIGRR